MKNSYNIYIVLLLSVFLVSNLSFSQSIRQIKSSSEYQWGIGKDEDYKKADQLAFEDLISKISGVFVQSENEYSLKETDGDINEYFNSIVRTYSRTTLPQTMQLVEEKKGKTTVLRYLPKADIPKIFEQRENKIRDFTTLAIHAEKEFRIGDALRYYYWAYTLLLSHPQQNEIEMEFEGMGELLLNAALYDKINSVFSNLDIKVSDFEMFDETDKKNILLDITYNNVPVENLDYSYFTGQGFSNLTSAKDGLGLIELYNEASSSLDQIDMRIEYEYKNKSFDKELTEVLSTVQVPFFKKSKYRLQLRKKEEKKQHKPETFKAKDVVYEPVAKETFDASKYKKDVGKIISTIQKQEYDKISDYFTPDGVEMYNALLKYGKVKILPFDTLKVVKMKNEVIVRSVPMSFYFPNNNREFIENVVFTFNEEKKVDAVSFALSDVALNDILLRSKRFGTIEDKYQLIKFMEYYKTAYSLERLEYIESIFAENALIIVGKVLRVAEPIDGMYNKLGSNNVEYVKLSKQEYMERLEKAFMSKEFINIEFEDNKIKKVNGDEKIYGIQIAQHYYSSNYSDFGYLFLMIDLNDSINPKIYVRTWQPEKNEDGSVFGLGDFYFN